jgi:DNA polymerase-1
LHDISPDKVTKQQRQEAKAANFGFPGGLGVETFIEFSRGYDLELSIQQAHLMKDAWFAAFPEMEYYMREEEKDEAVWTMSGRKRANATFCARKNTPFQGSAADGAKIALYNLDLNGFKLVGFVHDEIISEVSVCDADSLKEKQERIMVESMQIITPDVKVGVESVISPFYTK